MLLDDFMTRPLEANTEEQQLHQVVAAHNTTLEWSNHLPLASVPVSIKFNEFHNFLFQAYCMVFIGGLFACQWIVLVMPFLLVGFLYVLQNYILKGLKKDAYYGVCKEGIWLSDKEGVTFYGFEDIWSFDHTHHPNGTTSICIRKERRLNQRDGWGRPAIALTLKNLRNSEEILIALKQLHKQHPSYHN